MSYPYNERERTDNKDKLEALIDGTSLQEVLYLIAYICTDKAEHLAANWQDDTAARVWNRRADKIAALAVNF
jgi:hypothetical protein